MAEGDSNYVVGVKLKAEGSTLASEADKSAESLKRVEEQARRTGAALGDQGRAHSAAAEQIRAQRDAQTALTSETVSGVTALAGLATAAATAAAAIGGAYVAAQIKGAFAAKDHAAALHNLSQSYGVSTEALSAYRYQMSLAGVSQDTFSGAIKTLSKNIAEARGGIGDGGALFRLLGRDIDAAVRSGASLEALLPMLADKFAQFKDGPEKVAFAYRLFGSAAERLLPELSKGAAGMQAAAKEAAELGQIVGPDFAKNADQFNSNMTRANALFTAGRNAIANEYLPALNSFIERFMVASKLGGGAIAGADVMMRGKLLEMYRAEQARVEKLSPGEGAGYNRVIAKLEADPLVTQYLQKTDPWRLAMDEQNARVDALRAGARTKDAPVYAGRGAGADREQNAVDSLVKQATEMLALSKAQADATEKLTSAEQLRVRVLADMNEGLLDRGKVEASGLLATLGQAAAVQKETEKRKAAEKALEDYNRAHAQYLAKQWQEIEQLDKSTQKQQEHAQEIGLTTEELGRLRIARAEQTLAIARQNEAIEILGFSGEQELRIARARVEIAERGVEAARSSATRSVVAEQAKEAQQEWKRTADVIERSLMDALMRGFDKGKSFAENFRNALVNMFKTLVLEPIIRPIAQAGANLVTGAMQSIGGSLFGGGGGGGGGNLLSAANTAYSIFGGGAAGVGSLTGAGVMTAAPVFEAGSMIAAAEFSSLASVAGAEAAIGAMGMMGPVGLGLAALALFGGDMFGGGGGPKPAELGLFGGAPGQPFYIGQNNMPGGEANLPLYNQVNATLNDRNKFDPATLRQFSGQWRDLGSDPNAAVQQLLQVLAPAAGAAQSQRTAQGQMRGGLLAAQDPMGYWSEQVRQLDEDLGASATSIEEWRTQFLAALDETLTPAQFAKWQQLGAAIEQAGDAAGNAAGKFSTDSYATLVDYRRAVRLAGGIPQFASGGDHGGGLAILGESGAEIVNMGPAHVTSNADTRRLLDMSGVERRLERLESALIAIAKSTGKSAQLGERWDGDGLPVRGVDPATPLKVSVV